MNKVSKVDWSLRSIERGGVIPYVYYDRPDRVSDRSGLYFAFCVNKFSGKLSTIGGQFDSAADYDLLDTVIREYREEVEDNLPDLSYKLVTGSPVIVDEANYTILYKFEDRDILTREFTPNDEIETIVWLNVKQLKIISYWLEKDKETMNSNNKIMLAMMSHPLKNIVSNVILFAEEYPTGYIPVSEPFSRRKRETVKKSRVTISNYDEAIKYLEDDPDSLLESRAIITRRDGNLYFASPSVSIAVDPSNSEKFLDYVLNKYRYINVISGTERNQMMKEGRRYSPQVYYNLVKRADKLVNVDLDQPLRLLLAKRKFNEAAQYLLDRVNYYYHLKVEKLRGGEEISGRRFYNVKAYEALNQFTRLILANGAPISVYAVAPNYGKEGFSTDPSVQVTDRLADFGFLTISNYIVDII